MLIALLNPAELVLDTQAVALDGSAKTNVTGGSVRVFHLVGGSEVNLRDPVDLERVGVSSTWRYLWHPSALPAGRYTAEYRLTDSDGVVAMGTEDLVVQTDLMPTLNLIRKCETNRIRLDESARQMVVYDDDETTELFRFNCFDRYGNPNVEEVFDRRRA